MRVDVEIIVLALVAIALDFLSRVSHSVDVVVDVLIDGLADVIIGVVTDIGAAMLAGVMIAVEVVLPALLLEESELFC